MTQKHYLYSTWYWLNTQQQRHCVDPAWKDLKTFISDLGERPSDQHRLHKIDSTIGYVRGNVCWRLMLKHNPEIQPWHKRNVEKFKGYKLKHRFNISMDTYNTMLVSQHSCCAICGINHVDYPKNFAVDHCHTTGKIRGLLCSDCNFMLGNAKDNIETLSKGILYLQGQPF